MKTKIISHVVAAIVGIFTFLVCLSIYQYFLPQDTSYTVTVPKTCILNEVKAGADYVFDCPK